MKNYEDNPEFQKFLNAQKSAQPAAYYEEPSIGSDEWSQNGTAIRQFFGFFLPILGVAFFCFGMSKEANRSKAWRVLAVSFIGIFVGSFLFTGQMFYKEFKADRLEQSRQEEKRAMIESANLRVELAERQAK